MSKRIAVMSGSFDPVHAGHIGLGLAALQVAQLDSVYFLPESRPRPRGRTAVTYIPHRIAMLRRATTPYKRLKVLELPDSQFTVGKSLPRLLQRFPDDHLFFIIGSDTLEHIGTWPLITRLLQQSGLIIGVRSDQKPAQVKKLIAALPHPPQEVYVVTSPKPKLSSRQIRERLHHGKTSSGVLESIKPYIKSHWLYASPSATSASSSNSDS